jgi:PAS domain S-box-containing protein
MYSTLVEASLTGVYIEQDGKIRFANRRFGEIYGYSREEIIGIESWRLVHPEDRAMVRDFRQKRIRGEPTPSEYAARGLTKDGRTVWVMRRNTRLTFQQKPAILGNLADITEQKQTETALKESQRALRALSARLLVAEENERRRIANELHDGIGQSLSAIKFSIENTLAQIGQGAFDAAGRTLETLVALTRETIEDTRRVVMDLRPSTLDDLGILPTVAWLCREFQSLHPGIRIEQEITAEESDVPDILKTPIYRILQEALNNVVKHSHAVKVRISLRKSARKLQMEIEDDGQGFNVAAAGPSLASKTGFGLASMRERTEMLGGTFFIQSAEGTGTHIRALWPLDEESLNASLVKRRQIGHQNYNKIK